MATRLLIDTDVLIDYLRDYSDAVSYVEAQQERLLISVVTVAELYAGVREGEERSRRTGSVQRFILFGRYVTAEPNPHDVDIFLVMRGSFEPRDAPPEAQLLFEHGTAQSELGASIFWVNAETSFADTEDLIIGWQTRCDLQRRGKIGRA